MSKIKIAVSLFFLVFLMACQGETHKKFTLAELEANKNNALKLQIEEKPNLKTMTEGLFDEDDTARLIKRLNKEDPGLLEISYALYVLGTKYFETDDFEKGMHYLQIAADQYLNPLAMGLLARIYSEKRETVLAKFPKEAKIDFEQNFSKSYHYLHWALNCAILTMERFEDRYAVDRVNFYATPLIDLFEHKDSTRLGYFDVEAAAKAMEAQLPEIRKEFEALYPPKPVK